MLSEKIKELRKKKGLTQEELANKLNVSRQAIAKWESGESIPDVYKILQIAKFFEVPFSQVEEMFIKQADKQNSKHHTNNSSWLNKQLHIEELERYGGELCQKQ